MSQSTRSASSTSISASYKADDDAPQDAASHDPSCSYTNDSYTMGTSHLIETTKTAGALGDTQGREASEVSLSGSPDAGGEEKVAPAEVMADDREMSASSIAGDDSAADEETTPGKAETGDAQSSPAEETTTAAAEADTQGTTQCTALAKTTGSQGGSLKRKKERKDEYKGAPIKRPWVKVSARGTHGDTPARPMEETLEELQNVKGKKLSPEAVAKQLEMVIELEAQALGCGSVKESKMKVAGASRHLVARKLSLKYLRDEDPDDQHSEPSLPAVTNAPCKKVYGCSERLFKLPKPRQPPSTPSALCKNPVKKPIDELVTNLYSNPIQKYTENGKKLTHKYVQDSKTRSFITEDQKVETSLRLVDAEVKKREDKLKKLHDKYASSQPKKRLDKDQQDASLARLHEGGVDKQREVMGRLKVKYVEATQTKYNKLSESEWETVVSRLRDR
eukprot:TRINITY_DN10230_c0_g1_i1.p1 TRINITY_DN10230_c0_g1~~TRINITY_DN10230_c0_g1_i1.p1  ORF type:complete len:483 (+),score=119.49 TRINITY_DN10230_c0_g1_i1:104-1450(+)